MKTTYMIRLDPDRSITGQKSDKEKTFIHNDVQNIVTIINEDIKKLNPVPEGMCGFTISSYDNTNKEIKHDEGFLTIQNGEIQPWH